MGCSSCGHKYPGSGASRGRRYRLVRKSGKLKGVLVNSPGDAMKANPAAGIIQPQPEAGIPIPPDTTVYNPATGHIQAVMDSGYKGEATIPNNTAQPEKFDVVTYPDEDSNPSDTEQESNG